MALINVQGFESVSNVADMNLQGITNTIGWSAFSKPSSRFQGTRSFQFEDTASAASDYSPTFAGTSSTQFNTGKTINALWNAGGFVFGSAAKFRDTSQQYALGDLNGYSLSIVGTGNDVSSTDKMCWDGSRYWALASKISASSSSTSATELRYSTDLQTWSSPVTQPPVTTATGYLAHISFINGYLVVTTVAGTTPSTNATTYWYSSDAGNTWTQTRVSTATNLWSLSNMVYVNSTGTYYVSSGVNGGSSYSTFKATNIAGPWTQIDNYVNNTGNTGGIDIVSQLMVDTYRNLVWVLATNSQNASSTTAKIRYFSTSTETFTNAWVVTAGGNASNANQRSIAVSSSVVLSNCLDGSILRTTNTDLTSWTRISPTHASIGIIYNAASDQFISFCNDGYIGYSSGSDGNNWTYTLPFGFTTTTVAARTMWSCGMIANGLVVGYGRQGVMYAPASAPTGWAMSYRPEIWRSVAASNSNNRSARLGIASINSSGRQSYVGLTGIGDLTANTGASIALLPLNAVTDTTAYSTTTVPYLNTRTNTPWHFYELIFTATSTVNQFTVQVAIDGSLTSLTATVALAGTSDTTSTLYWTLPCRDTSTTSVAPSLIEFDDIYVLDFSGSINNTVMLDCHIVPYRPSSDVQTQWTKTPSNASSNSVAVASLSNSTAAGYVSTTVNGNKDIYNADNSLDISQYAVKAVTVEANISNASLVPGSASVGIQSGSASVDSGAISATLGTSTYVQKIQETDPNTGSNWSRTTAKAAQITINKVS